MLFLKGNRSSLTVQLTLFILHLLMQVCGSVSSALIHTHRHMLANTHRVNLPPAQWVFCHSMIKSFLFSLTSVHPKLWDFKNRDWGRRGGRETEKEEASRRRQISRCVDLMGQMISKNRQSLRRKTRFSVAQKMFWHHLQFVSSILHLRFQILNWCKYSFLISWALQDFKRSQWLFCFLVYFKTNRWSSLR